MLNITHIDHLNLHVSNFKESIEFYKDLFGMEVKEEGVANSGLPYAVIGISGKIMLCLYDEKGIDYNKKGFNHLGFNIENFDEASAILTQKGIPTEYGEITEYDHSRSIYVKDPSGIELELTEVFGGGL